MGLVGDLLGSALGANDVKNGFNSPKLSFPSKQPQRSPTTSASYSPGRLSPLNTSRSESRDDRHCDQQNTYHLQPVDNRHRSRQSSRGSRSSEVDRQDYNYPAHDPQNYDRPDYGRSNYTRLDYDGPAHGRQNYDDQVYYDHDYDRHGYDSQDYGRQCYNRQLSPPYQPSVDETGVAARYGRTNVYDASNQRSNVAGGRNQIPQLDNYADLAEAVPRSRGALSEGIQLRTSAMEDLKKPVHRPRWPINIAIIPNPEAQIFQKGASIAGWFVPGAASLGLIAGQVAVGVGGAIGHRAMIKKVLAKANLDVFVPQGLEICIGKAKDVDNEVGCQFAPQHQQHDLTPEERVNTYGQLLASIDETWAPAQKGGRNDPIALLGRGIANRDMQKKTDKAQRKFSKGRTNKMEGIEKGLQWLIVRSATPGAILEWQKVFGSLILIWSKHKRNLKVKVDGSHEIVM